MTRFSFEYLESHLAWSRVNLLHSRGIVSWLTHDANNPELRSGKWIHGTGLRINISSRSHLYFAECRSYFFELLRYRLAGDRRAGHLLESGCYLGRAGGANHARTSP
jgi:hypothetical protein